MRKKNSENMNVPLPPSYGLISKTFAIIISPPTKYILQSKKYILDLNKLQWVDKT